LGELAYIAQLRQRRVSAIGAFGRSFGDAANLQRFVGSTIDRGLHQRSSDESAPAGSRKIPGGATPMPRSQSPEVSVSAHFTKAAPNVRATYRKLLKIARALGPVREEAKKTSIHLVRKSAFAGIATRKESLILTLKASTPLKHPRFERSEQASAHRWHHEIRLHGPAEVDKELKAWLAEAYSLAA